LVWGRLCVMLYPILIPYKYTYISHSEVSYLHPLYVIHSFSTFCSSPREIKGFFFFLFQLFRSGDSAAEGLCSRLSSAVVILSSLSLLLEDSISFNFQFFFFMFFLSIYHFVCSLCLLKSLLRRTLQFVHYTITLYIFV